MTAIQLLSDADDLPAGLTPGLVNRWMNGLIKSAPRHHYLYVADTWAALPNGSTGKRGKAYPTNAEAWIEMTDGMSALLRAELVRSGVDPAALLAGSPDVPEGLTKRIILGWLYRHTKTTRAAHWTFVIEHLASLPDGRRQWAELDG